MKLYDLSYPLGTYTDSKTGEEKTRWLRVGAVIKKSNGKLSAKIDALPTDFNGWLNVAEPRQPHEQAAQTAQAQAPVQNNIDDDPPF